QRYEITVTESKDQRGNVRNNQTFSVLFVLAEAAEPFDVVINEIMADPNPALGLPATEFVEIYNRSDKIIDLQTLTIASGGTPQALPAIKLFPNSFAIVCDNSDEADFLPFGTVAAVSTFPSLSDNGDEVLLSDQDGTVIHFVSYLPDWYQDTEKAKGGWTLELISHQRPCVQNADNWIASDNLSGGTPGAINSVNQDLPDNESPGLLSVFPEDEQTLLLSFNEALDGFTAEDATNYSLSNGIEVLSADLIGLAGNVVQVNLAEALQPNQRYELRISTTFTDCVGNAFDESQLFEFGLPEQVLPNDLVINEVLFNPYTGGVDFVELYNKSDKIINTGSLIIGNFYDGASSADAIQSSTLLFPGAYLAISTSPIRLASFYTVGEPRTLLQNPLPAFSNDVGNVTLAANNGVETIIIDAFDYDKEFHLPLLNDLNGVSLERIDPFAETQNADNWQSAARLAGFATPGYQNSQFIDRTAAPANNFFSIENSTFSPDEDGFEDVLLLHFEADQAGYSGSIRIFDAAGRQVRSLIENEPMGTRSSFKWDGSTDQNTRARLGIYVIWMEIFDLEGQVQQFREVCVVAGKL
ncbi:MAG: lamin tail domain-containing protein, partial [Bacteroidota bacterium]